MGYLVLPGGDQALGTISDARQWGVTAEMRHDVPRLKSSWGVTYTAAEHGATWYADEVLQWHDHATWGAYLETTLIPGVKTTLNGKAVFGALGDRLRRFYSPTRTGADNGLEARRQRQGGVVSLVIAKSF